MTPTRSVFKPEAGDSYSKSQVNRAGKTIRRVINELPEGGELVDDDGQALFDALRVLEWWRTQHARPLSIATAGLRYHVGKELRPGETVDVTQRLKKRTTMMSKLLREPTMAMTQMHDIGGVRARLGTLQEVRAVSRRLKKNWLVVRTRDYIENPKTSGYRAIHHSVKKEGYIVEVQLRTFRQDAWANQVENDGRDLGEGFKFGYGAEEIHDYYRAISEAFAFLDQGLSLPIELSREVNDRYHAVAPRLRRQHELRGGLD